jgi:hypothetical protein
VVFAFFIEDSLFEENEDVQPQLVAAGMDIIAGQRMLNELSLALSFAPYCSLSSASSSNFVCDNVPLSMCLFAILCLTRLQPLPRTPPCFCRYSKPTWPSRLKTTLRTTAYVVSPSLWHFVQSSLASHASSLF